MPDLGADLVRVYQADAGNLKLTPIASLEVAPGAGPRHGAFKTGYNKTFFYVATELANTIIGYEVLYGKNNTLNFSELFTIPLHGDNRTLVETAAAGEIIVTVRITQKRTSLRQRKKKEKKKKENWEHMLTGKPPGS